MAPIIVPGDERTYTEGETESHPKHGIAKDVCRERPGSLSTKKIRVVCGKCNNGWMSQTEGKVRPLLEPLIRGETAIFDANQQLLVAQWITLKVLVAEHAAVGKAVTPPDLRTAFMERAEIPHYFRIYVATNAGRRTMGYVRHTNTGHAGPVPPPVTFNRTVKNVQQVSWVMGRLVVHVNAANVEGWEIERGVLIPLVHDNLRIFPLQRDIFQFPTTPALSDNDFGMLSTSVRRLTNHPDAQWVE